MTHQVTPKKMYYTIFAALICFTLLTVGIAEIDLGEFNIIIALLIAGTKACLVAWFFMHVNHAKPLTRVFVMAGLFWLAIMFALTFSDFLTRYWLPPGRGWS